MQHLKSYRLFEASYRHGGSSLLSEDDAYYLACIIDTVLAKGNPQDGDILCSYQFPGGDERVNVLYSTDKEKVKYLAMFYSPDTKTIGVTPKLRSWHPHTIASGLLHEFVHYWQHKQKIIDPSGKIYPVKYKHAFTDYFMSNAETQAYLSQLYRYFEVVLRAFPNADFKALFAQGDLELLFKGGDKSLSLPYEIENPLRKYFRSDSFLKDRVPASVLQDLKRNFLKGLHSIWKQTEGETAAGGQIFIAPGVDKILKENQPEFWSHLQDRVQIDQSL